MARHSPNPHKTYGFAESNQKVRVELKKADLMLQKELQRLEKQTKATTNIISDHQQAMKMSWRRLEFKRQQDESPSPGRKTKRNGSLVEDTRRKLLFANTTVVSLDLPNDTTRSRAHTSAGTRHSYEDDELNTGGSVSTLQPRLLHENGEGVEPRPQTRGGYSYIRTFKASPYISSPYAYRRQGPDEAALQLGSGQYQGQKTHPLANSNTVGSQLEKSNGQIDIGETSKVMSSVSLEENDYTENDENPANKKKTFTLPCGSLDNSLQASSAVVIAKSSTVDKNTLLKAKEAMNFDSKSCGPNSFQQFYSSSPNSNTDLSSKILLSPVDPSNGSLSLNEDDMMKQLTEEEQEELRKAKEKVSV